LYTALRGLEAPPVAAGAAPDAAASGADDAARASAWQAFHAAMDDDFNTPEAVAVLQSLASEINRARDAGDPARAAVLAKEMRAMGAVLGILSLPAEEWFRASKSAASAQQGGWDDARIEAAIAERKAARAGKDFKRSDQIRDELAAAGIVLEDKPGGITVWRRS
jgi:cysteinyl-tRNA synthetase